MNHYSTKISKKELYHCYISQKKSVSVIASEFECSQNRINYWLNKYKIPKRSISDSVYLKHNPAGDPFSLKKIRSKDDYFLYGLGLGLYWGEGTKKSICSIRLGNTDPRLIRKFIHFLKEIYGIEERKLHFGLQIFDDIDPVEAKLFWGKYLNVKASQFQKIIVSKIRGEGTYRNFSKYGVLTVYFNNRKLRDVLCGAIEKL